MNSRPLIFFSCAIAAILVACGDGTGDIREANADVLRIEAETEALAARVSEAEELALKADATLKEAREELANAEKELATARQQVEEQASDATLFRAIQKHLLDDRAFEDVAISARVANRVVTLEGRVPDEALKKRAEEIATTTPGVATVINQIKVDVEKSK